MSSDLFACSAPMAKMPSKIMCTMLGIQAGQTLIKIEIFSKWSADYNDIRDQTTLEEYNPRWIILSFSQA